MATRQYIGARYVPKFFNGEGGSTEWVSGVRYEPLTIVTHLGNSYTSKKPVPVGIDILNTEYWASTGMWNAQVEELREEVSDLNDTISLMTNRKFLFVGDSYVGTSHYVSKLNAILGLTNNVNSFCYAVGGEGFTTGTNGNGFLYQLEQAVTNIDDTDEITDIIVCGGANDAETNQSYSEDSIATNFTAFVTYAHNHFANAKIHIGFIGFCHYDSSTLENRTQKNLELMLYHYKDNAFKKNCAYMNNIEYATRFLGQLSTKEDGLHPNSTGGDIICYGIVNYLKTGMANISLYDFNITTGEPIVSGSHYASVSQTNDKTILKFPEFAGSFTGTLYGGNRGTGIANRNVVCEFNNVFVNDEIHAPATLFLGGASPYTYDVDLMIKGNTMSMCVLHASSSGWDVLTVSNKVFVLSSSEFIFDTIKQG